MIQWRQRPTLLRKATAGRLSNVSKQRAINIPVAHPGDHHRRTFRLRRCDQSMGSGWLRRRYPELSRSSLDGERGACILFALVGDPCGFALIFRRLYSGALTLVLALMVVFIGASIAAKARGIDISCGCFGHVSDQLSFAWHLVLDFAILAAVAALWRWDRGNPRSPDNLVVSLSSRAAQTVATGRSGTSQKVTACCAGSAQLMATRCGGASESVLQCEVPRRLRGSG